MFGPSAQTDSGGLDSTILRIVISAIGAVAIPALSWFAWDGFMDHALDPDRGSEHMTLATGATGVLEDSVTRSRTLRVTIANIKPAVHVSSNDLGAPGPGEELWGVEVKVQNIGPAAVYSPVWIARSADGKDAYSAFPSGASTVYSAVPLLDPGETRRGWLYFTVPKGKPVTWLHVGTFLGEGGITFDAQ